MLPDLGVDAKELIIADCMGRVGQSTGYLDEDENFCISFSSTHATARAKKAKTVLQRHDKNTKAHIDMILYYPTLHSNTSYHHHPWVQLLCIKPTFLGACALCVSLCLFHSLSKKN